MARGAVANLAVSLTARTKGFSKAMKRARRQLNDFGSSALRAGAIGAVGAGVALAAWTAFAAKGIDAAAKLARNLALSNEQMQAFSRLADLMGIDTGVMTKALNKMRTTIGDVLVKGSKEGMDAFSKLRLDPAKLGALTTIQQFTAIGKAVKDFEARAVKGLSGPERQMAALRAQTELATIQGIIFGRGGKEMFDAIRNGEDVLVDSMVLIRRLGLGMSESMSSGVETANDQVSDLWFVLNALGDLIAATVMPYVGDFALRLQKLAEGAIEGAGGGEELARAIGTLLVQGAKDAWNGLQPFLEFLGNLIDVFTTLFDWIGRVGKAIANIGAGTLATVVQLAQGNFRGAISAYTTSANDAVGALAGRSRDEVAADTSATGESEIERLLRKVVEGVTGPTTLAAN